MNSQGFSMILVPVFLLMFGAFVSLTIKETQPKEFYFDVRTQNKMEHVQKALAAYAHRNYRVPCPADPAENNPDLIGEERSACVNVADRTGIIPFRELGLTVADIRDEWGNFITYNVSPSFTRQIGYGDFTTIPGEHFVGGAGAAPDVGNNLPVPVQDDALTYVHEMCRTDQWIRGGQTSFVSADGTAYNLETAGPDGTSYARNINGNLFKAQFCCPTRVNSDDPVSFDSEPFKDDINQNIDDRWDDLAEFTWTDPYDNKDKLKITSSNLNTGMPTGCKDGHCLLNWSEHGDGGGIGVGNYSSGGTVHGSKAYNESLHVHFLPDTKPDQVTYVLADIGSNNLGDEYYYSVTFEDGDGNELITVHTKADLPNSALGGIAEVTFTKYDFTDPHMEYYNKSGSNFSLNNNPSSTLETELQDMGLSIEDAHIKRLDLHGKSTSFLLSGIEYMSVSTLPDNDIVLLNEDGDRVIAARSGVSYRPADEESVGSVNPDYEAVAYVLISHGANGEGAYLVNGTAAQNDNIAEGLEEAENLDGDGTIRNMRKIDTGDSDHFDDIVLWDSQFTLYNALSNGTCEASQTL